MAIDSKKVLDIDTGAAQMTISKLKEVVKEYRKELDGCIVGSKEAADATAKLEKAQVALQAAQKGAINTVGELDNSYNGLSRQMKKLMDEQKKIDTSTEAGMKAFQEYGKQIYGINDKLKSLDEMNGVYSRNVGNYTKSMQEAFSKVGLTIGNISPLFQNLADATVKAGAEGAKGFTALSAGAKGLTSSLKALVASPAGAAILAITLAVKAASKVFDAFKSSVEGNEVASNNMAKALAPIRGIIDKIKDGFDSVVETITGFLAIVGQATVAIGKWLGFSMEMSSLEANIAEMEASNAEQHRQILVENSKLELDASEARQKAADKENYSAQERLKFAQEYADKQKKIAENNLKEAQDALKLLEAQAATGKNNKEMNDKIAEAQANVNKVQQAYNDTLRSTNKEIYNINQEIAKETEDKQKKAAEAWKKHVEAVKNAKKAYQEVSDALKEFFQNDLQNDVDKINKSYDENTKKIKENAKVLKKSATEINELLAKNEEARSKELTDVYNKYGKQIEDANNAFFDLYKTDDEKKLASVARKLEAEKKAYDEILKLQVQLGVITEAEMKERLKDYSKYIKGIVKKTQKELTDATLKKTVEDIISPEVDLRKSLKEKILKQFESGDIDNETAKKALAALGFNAEAIDAILEEISNKVEWKKLTDGFAESLDLMADFASEIASIGEGISSEWSNVFSTLSTGLQTISKDLHNGKGGFTTYAKAASFAFGTASAALAALADEQDTATREGFETAKKLNIAQAITSTLAGIAGAWASSMELVFPANVIVGSLLSAMMGGIGAAQIAQISQTSFDGGGSIDSNAGVNLAALQGATSPTTYTQDVYGANIQESIANKQMWVSVSEIDRVQNRVGVAENESKF